MRLLNHNQESDLLGFTLGAARKNGVEDVGEEITALSVVQTLEAHDVASGAQTPQIICHGADLLAGRDVREPKSPRHHLR